MRLGYLEMLDALGAQPTPAQREFCRVAFDLEAPGEDATAERIWGVRRLEAPTSPPRVVGAVCGRGSGKTRFFGAYRLLHLALTVDLSGLPHGEDAVCPIVAPDLATARHTLAFARGAAEELLPDAILEASRDRFAIRREGRKRVVIEAKAASAGGKAIRGRSMPGALLEELAFFFDADHRVNDIEVFRALQPRIMSGGQLLCISSPWARSGVLWDLYSDNYGHPHGALVGHAPTLLMREGGPGYAEIAEAVASMRRTDPENARREFDAEFLSTNASAYFDQRAIEQAIDKTITLDDDPDDPEMRHVQISPRPGLLVHFGGDLGFTRDSAASVGIERGELYRVCDLKEYRPKRGPLKPSTTVHAIAERIRVAGGDCMVADAHYRETVREHLTEAGLDLVHAPEGATGKAEAHSTARTVLHSGLARIPDYPRFLRQMQQLEARPTSGGQLSFSSPRWATGGHGDILSAWVLATWRAFKLGWSADTRGTREKAYEQRVDEKVRRIRERHEREEYGSYEYGD